MTNLTVAAANLTGTVPLAQLPTAVLTNNENGVSLSGSFAGNGGGLTNLASGFKWQVVAGSFAASATEYRLRRQQRLAGDDRPARVPSHRRHRARDGGWSRRMATRAVSRPVRARRQPGPGRRNLDPACHQPELALRRLLERWHQTGRGGGWRAALHLDRFRLELDGACWQPGHGTRVASSADGTKLVAGVNSGQIYTSTDSGATWTPRPASGQWYSVASSSDGTKLVAASLNGQIYTSTTSGTTWTPRDSARQWYSVASSSDGTKLVAVVYGGQIYTLTNSGQSWTPRDSGRSWYSVASSGTAPNWSQRPWAARFTPRPIRA